jgi:poly-gamma-glutamate synthesis protein (capsule biosynthesis protein)
LKFLAFGDINLGRQVGQKILADSIAYPFQNIKGFIESADVVFANLESQLSDQNGETQHPFQNLVFTGPPTGARSLAWVGISVVSTANNHAYDYGISAMKETIENLDSAGIWHAGTSVKPESVYFPVIFKKKGIRIAFFACTDVMNRMPKGWDSHIACVDTGKILPQVRAIRDSVDLIVMSYHGGNEYSRYPTRGTKNFAHQMMDGGVNIFLGHHPHVPQGNESFSGGQIFYSLGNFVFYQPQYYWTQRSIGVMFKIKKRGGKTLIDSFSCYPIRAGLQPSLIDRGDERQEVIDKIEELSRVGRQRVSRARIEVE